MSRHQAQPYPHHVWLNVNFAGVPTANAQGVTAQLQQITGWHTSLTGDDGGALRYRYKPGREESIPRQAQAIVQRAGGRKANVTGFVLWRLDFTFRHVLDVGVFAPMAETIRRLSGVLSTQGSLGDPILRGLSVEFRGEPRPEVLARIRELVAPHL